MSACLHGDLRGAGVGGWGGEFTVPHLLSAVAFADCWLCSEVMSACIRVSAGGCLALNDLKCHLGTLSH